MQSLPELFEPMTVGRMQVANRLMMAGMSAGVKVDENGEVAPEMVAYFVERARGGPGMMAIGASQVVPPQSDRERLSCLGLNLNVRFPPKAVIRRPATRTLAERPLSTVR